MFCISISSLMVLLSSFVALLADSATEHLFFRDRQWLGVIPGGLYWPVEPAGGTEMGNLPVPFFPAETHIQQRTAELGAAIGKGGGLQQHPSALGFGFALHAHLFRGEKMHVQGKMRRRQGILHEHIPDRVAPFTATEGGGVALALAFPDGVFGKQRHERFQVKAFVEVVAQLHVLMQTGTYISRRFQSRHPLTQLLQFAHPSALTRVEQSVHGRCVLRPWHSATTCRDRCPLRYCGTGCSRPPRCRNPPRPPAGRWSRGSRWRAPPCSGRHPCCRLLQRHPYRGCRSTWRRRPPIHQAVLPAEHP